MWEQWRKARIHELMMREEPERRPFAPLAALVGAVILSLLFYQIVRHFRRAQKMPVREQSFVTTSRPTTPPRPHVPPEARGGTPIQEPHEGEGMLFHRRYSALIDNPSLSAEALMEMCQADPNRFSPQVLARFEKTKGAEGQMRVGDEYFIHITGPWNGPVRVKEVGPRSFGFVTLDGHLEAGEIAFRCDPDPTRPHAIKYEIEAQARSRDKAVHFAYDVTGLAKAAQTSMWANWCRQVVEESGGELVGEIEIVTEKQPVEEKDESD